MERGLADLSLEDGEEEAFFIPVEVEGQSSAYSFCLVGCFLTASVVHFPAMRNTLANIWHPLEGHGDSFCTMRLQCGMQEMEMGWDLTLRAQPRKATTRQDSCHIIGEDLLPCKGQQVESRLNCGEIKNGPDGAGPANGLDLMKMDCELEDDSIASEAGKKKAKIRWKLVVGNQLILKNYRRLPVGMPTGRNENFLLECSWIGESASSKETSAYAENLSSPNCLLYEDKIEC
ncbi:5'-nucleotidase surE [Gossypium australe]|uniref:5'-nucleotidase surE n=1 Tax=Gossypium australe TaxID=47621 RepID=A0A5B6VAR0_9ROSI|nr:5'-nucleotidase surE [Gossypium australe]